MGLAVVGVLSLAMSARAEDEEPTPQSDFSQMSLEQLLNVEVTSASKKSESLYKAPSIMNVVTKTEIDIYGDRNLLQLLQRQPSVYTRDSYMYRNNIASVRGDMSTHLDLHNLILFNGRPIRESSFGGINFPVYMTFPLAGLDSVELIRGPGSVLYGTNAFTGVMDLKTKVPERNTLSLSTLAGSYGTYETSLTAGGHAGDLGYVSSMRVAGQDGYNYALTDGQGHFGAASDENHSVSGMAHLEYQGLTLDVFAVNMETFHLGPLPWWSLPAHEFGINKLFANVGYKIPLHERVMLELNATVNLQENRFSNVTRTVGLNSVDFIGEATLFANPIDNLNIVLGYMQEYQMNYAPDPDEYQSIAPYHHSPRSAYLQADYSINEMVKVIAGAQWNESSQHVSAFSSRYGVILTPHKNWGVKLLRGEAFRAPFAIETDVFDVPILMGNKGLSPETITTYDAQLFYTDEKTYAALTYFNSTIDDLIIRDTSVSPASFKNGGRQKFQGVEFEGKRMLMPHLNLIGSATYQTSNQTSDLNPSTAPEFMAKLGIDYTWDWGSASLFYNYFAKPPRLATEVVVNPQPEAANYLTLNLQLDMSQLMNMKKGQAIATFRIENLLNENTSVPEFNRGGNPNSLPGGPGTTVFGGIKINF